MRKSMFLKCLLCGFQFQLLDIIDNFMQNLTNLDNFMQNFSSNFCACIGVLLATYLTNPVILDLIIVRNSHFIAARNNSDH